ncbi:WYL domain-containing protein [Gammaproteobacteria bacterium AB-CW1]|uniref:WYL domain-containing protein n=1 Tax=Natronospira elongata TaxID=3110268 RepID=A0AAP6MJE3_9GAMM|nr:WYL domain-containing protein [Gammaproteobacteria bacterium AB-CW1]
MSETSIRYVRMLEQVARWPRRVSCRELREKLAAEGFDVSKRTVERDLDKLSRWFPIVSDGASPQGWSWSREARGFELPAMSPATALAFLLLNEFSRPLLPNNMQSFLDEHLTRAREILEQTEKNQPGMSHWSELVAVVPRSQLLLPPKGDAEAIRTAYDALLEGCLFEAEYRAASRDLEPKTYRINPLGLILRDNVLYLACTLFNYEDIRLLALHRLGKARLLDEPGWSPKDFQLREYVASGAVDVLEGPEIELVADFERDAARHLSESPLSEDQQLEERGEDITRVTATVRNTRQLRWWLHGFGAAVEVIAPTELREEMAANARALLKHYG